MSFWFIISSHVWKCFTCTCVCITHMCLVLKEITRGHQIPWNWSYRGCKPLCGSWKQNPDPLLEQQMLLISELLLQLLNFFLRFKDFSNICQTYFLNLIRNSFHFFSMKNLLFFTWGKCLPLLNYCLTPSVPLSILSSY